MKNEAFAVARFENRNGTTSWRVTGWLHGLRIRKNFRSREEAAAEKAALEIKAIQATSGLRKVATSLTDTQVREAESAFQRLEGNPHPLSFYLEFALANYRAPQTRRPLPDAIADYVAAKTHEHEQGLLSKPQIERIRSDLKRLEVHFPKHTVAELSAPALVAFLEVGRPSAKTHNNLRGILSPFFKYAFHRGWIADNPIPRVPHYRIRRKRGSAVTLAHTQAAELMDQIEQFEGGRWVPYFALCLFAGIRPGVPNGEITKLRPGDIHLDAGYISISADVSKVREPRRVVIQPNLAAWLRAYPLSEFRIVVGNFQQRCGKLRTRFNLSHDVMRHTFISMHVAKFRSLGEAALQAGNSESIIRKHYFDLKTKEEAEAFFAIMPKHRTVPEAAPAPVPFRLPQQPPRLAELAEAG